MLFIQLIYTCMGRRPRDRPVQQPKADDEIIDRRQFYKHSRWNRPSYPCYYAVRSVAAGEVTGEGDSKAESLGAECSSLRRPQERDQPGPAPCRGLARGEPEVEHLLFHHQAQEEAWQAQDATITTIFFFKTCFN